jgi:hypothetical protein
MMKTFSIVEAHPDSCADSYGFACEMFHSAYFIFVFVRYDDRAMAFAATATAIPPKNMA